ncbi:MAG: hypothetical protein CMM07_01875 [Rhodopirellula sp.]|nr:hypothetical protein [Rhodopirellula sp.]
MSSTGVGSDVELLATGGVGCPRSHPQTTTTTKQTAADLKRLTLAPVVKGFQASNKHKAKRRRSCFSVLSVWRTVYPHCQRLVVWAA